MPVTLGYSALEGVLGMPDAIRLLEEVLTHEAAGRTLDPPKFSSDLDNGFMRMLFAADYEAGYGVTKASHAMHGSGVRNVVTLYRLRDGEVLAVMDGRLITDLRTGAATAVVARRVAVPPRATVGIIGSGHQARMQLESIATVHALASATVYSPTREHRERFASDMSRKLHLPIKVAESAEAAVRTRTVVVTASSARSSEPAVRGAWLEGCRLLCAVGNTRPQYSEIDVACLSQATLVITDTENALAEAGDLRQAMEQGAVPKEKRATLAQIVSGAIKVPAVGLVAYKSVGSALQDLALAHHYYELLGATAGVPAAADLARARQPMRELSAAAKPVSRKGKRS
jgi:ornithine cyclodeaminase/alanine dehydrogenase-like protein (mu-crystallin family)